MKNMSTAAAAAALLLSAGTAQAAEFDLSYTLLSGEVLTALITGTLQGDGNTVVVTDVTGAALDGVLGPVHVFLDSFTNLVGASGAPAQLTLDGSLADLAYCTDGPACTEGFGFDTTLTAFPEPIYTTDTPGNAFGSVPVEVYNVQNYSLVAVPGAEVPLPAAAPLLLAGLAGVAALRRRAG